MGTARQEIEHLEGHVHEAAEIFRSDRQKAARSLRRFHPRFQRASRSVILHARLTLEDARLVVAREHGFDSWKQIHAEAKKGDQAWWNLPPDRRTDSPALARAIRAAYTGDVPTLRRLLSQDPVLVTKRVRLERSGPFSNPSLLEIAAAPHQNGGRVPPHLIEVLTTVLKAGAGRRPRVVQGALNLAAARPWPGHDDAQRRSVRLLLQHGARPEPAMPRAMFQGSAVALAELARQGGRLDLVATAALGRMPIMRRRLLRATSLERRKALALACVNGRTEAVRVLLDAGVDPNRFNPRGFYEHSTPLHQAVWFGNEATVRLLVQRGADLSIRDKAHQGTALGWAKYGKRRAIARFLEASGPTQ